MTFEIEIQLSLLVDSWRLLAPVSSIIMNIELIFFREVIFRAGTHIGRKIQI